MEHSSNKPKLSKQAVKWIIPTFWIRNISHSFPSSQDQRKIKLITMRSSRKILKNQSWIIWNLEDRDFIKFQLKMKRWFWSRQDWLKVLKCTWIISSNLFLTKLAEELLNWTGIWKKEYQGSKEAGTKSLKTLTLKIRLVRNPTVLLFNIDNSKIFV